MISKEKGSFTIEATIVFSAVLLVIIGIIYMCIILYQQVYLQSLADKLVKSASNSWSSPAKDLFMGFIKKEDMKYNSLYWRIYDFEKDQKLEKLRLAAAYDFDKYSMLGKSNNLKVVPEISNELLVFKKIKITITSEYKNPVGKLLTVLGMGSVLKFSVTSEVMINEPSEFIKNTDLVIDLVREVDNKFADGKIANVKDSLTENITKIFGKIKGFADKTIE